LGLGLSEGLGIAFVRLKCEQQAETVLTCDLFPWLAGERALKCPQEVEAGVCTRGLDEPIGAD